MSVEFLLTTLVVVVTPGTGVIYTLAAALLHTSAIAFQTLKCLGVAHLLYMAWSTVREKEALAVDEETEVMTWMRRTFAGAFVALGARLAVADR